MGFGKGVRSEALFLSGRCCAICHKFCGVKMESHHIIQEVDNGGNTIENCIPLCFNCHADMEK